MNVRLDITNLTVRWTRYSAECLGDEFWECHWDSDMWVAFDPLRRRISDHMRVTGHTEIKIHTEHLLRPTQGPPRPGGPAVGS